MSPGETKSADEQEGMQRTAVELKGNAWQTGRLGQHLRMDEWQTVREDTEGATVKALFWEGQWGRGLWTERLMLEEVMKGM